MIDRHMRKTCGWYRSNGRRAFRGLTWLGRCVVPGLLLLGCAGADVPEERIVRFVDELTFGGPFDGHLPQDEELTRWTEDLRVALAGPGADQTRERVAMQLATFTAATGLGAAIVAQDSDPNVTVSFVETADFLINREHVQCFAGTDRDQLVIKQAEIQISIEDPMMVDQCLAHEFMHVFGLHYHSGIVRSALSFAHEEQAMTQWDVIALQTLYDPRLSLGVKRNEALPIMRQIVAERLAAR
jgi:hypothetical protein